MSKCRGGKPLFKPGDVVVYLSKSAHFKNDIPYVIERFNIFADDLVYLLDTIYIPANTKDLEHWDIFHSPLYQALR